MSQTRFTAPKLFNPGAQSPDEIIANFVIRLKEFSELFTAIKNDAMRVAPQHYMIQGQRGYGKTTLLLRLNLEIKNDPDLRQWLLPVMFDEEQYSVRTLAKFWEEVIDILEQSYDEFSGLSEHVDELYQTEFPEEEIFNLLLRSLKDRKKKLVLLLDNFGDMINKFTTKENQRLREVLNTCCDLRVIGASSTVLEFYHNYKEPFFDFFKVITLDELDSNETVQLLRKLGETYKAGEINNVIERQPERIEALRRLAGGVPRTIVLLFEIFVDDVDGSSFNDLEAILDRVTPLYKHRLDSLSVQQQAIIDAVAQNWDAISTKEIAKQVRMESKAVASQLNQLEKTQLVRKITTSTKNHLYQINERFFNIYYLMRLGKRKNRNKVLWLVRFLEIWCGRDEITQRTKRHIEALRAGAIDERHAFYFSQALAGTPSLPYELQHELLTKAREYLKEKQSEYAAEMDKSHIEVRQEIVEDLKAGRYNVARRKILNDGITTEHVEFELGNIVWEELKDFSKAEQYYQMAVEKGYANAMFNLAVLYQSELKKFSKAEQYYLMAVEKGHASAMNNLALLYKTEMKDFSKAEQYYLMAVGKGHANAIYNLAQLYRIEMKDFSKAEKYYLMAIEKGYAGAMNNLALLYETEMKDFSKAEKYYLMAVEKGHASAMYNLALLYETEMRDISKAEQYYLMAVEKGDVDAMFNLAQLYRIEMKDSSKTEQYYLMAVEKGHAKAMNNLSAFYINERKSNKVQALQLQKDAHRLAPTTGTAFGLVMTLLWNDEIEEAINAYRDNFEKEEVQKEVSQRTSSILLMFLAKKQYSFIHRLFEENKFEVREKYKAIYYVLLSLMGDEHADERKKMGPELLETVAEIVKEVERMAVDYA